MPKSQAVEITNEQAFWTEFEGKHADHAEWKQKVNSHKQAGYVVKFQRSEQGHPIIYFTSQRS